MGLFDFLKKKNVAPNNEEVILDTTNDESLDNLEENTSKDINEVIVQETSENVSDAVTDAVDDNLNETPVLEKDSNDNEVKETEPEEKEEVSASSEDKASHETESTETEPRTPSYRKIDLKTQIFPKNNTVSTFYDDKTISTIEVEENYDECVIYSVNENDEVKIITEEENKKESLFSKMKNGLLKTRSNLSSSLDNVFKAFTSISDDFYDELLDTLILSDLGARTSMDIIDKLKVKVKEEKIKDTEDAKKILINIISEILSKDNEALEIKSPTVILIIGVNGVGKTTTIGKLANKFKNEGKSVLLAAGDTFRAAAIDQLQEWGDRSDIPVIKHAENTDSSAVIYDAIASAKAKNVDVLICDTAGRLHNKKNLMAELEKINRVIGKEFPSASLETFLVLDGTTGQNALEQAKQFNEVCNITGLVLTKIDGTAKGGIVIAIKNELNIPVRFVGIGEGINDLEAFDADIFSNALFDN